MNEEIQLVPNLVKDLAKREKSANVFKERMIDMLDLPMPMHMIKGYADNGLILSGTTPLMMDAITAALITQAINGNITAYTTLRDTMGFKPIEKTQSDVVVRVNMSQEAKELGE